jgi:uncharacterized protein (DUF1330 family)
MTDTNKPAYFIACITPLDGEPDPEYGKRARGVAEKAELTPIAAGELGSVKAKVLEGELPPGATFIAIEKFPSMAALEEFYYSDEYQSAIPFRKDSVKMNFLVAVDGISEAELEAQREAALAAQSDG